MSKIHAADADRKSSTGKGVRIRVDKKSYLTYLIYGLVALLFFFCLYFYRHIDFGGTRVNASTLSFLRGRVLAVTEDHVLRSRKAAGMNFPEGSQKLEVMILEGDLKGRILPITNNLTIEHHIDARGGTDVVIQADRPEGVQPYFTIYNYDRSRWIYGMLAVFVFCLLLVGRGRGLRSVFSLAVGIALVFCVMIPLIYKGFSPLPAALFTAIISTSVMMFFLNGLRKKTAVDILSTSIGFLVSALLYLLISSVIQVNGFNLHEAEDLQFISLQSGLQIKGLLFCCILIASLGAVMDIAVSLSSSMNEILRLHPTISRRELLVSGLSIGKEIVGINVNTLIFAFTGSALTTLLVLTSYGVQFNQLLNSDFAVLELLRCLIAAFSIVLMVPLTALLFPRIMIPASKVPAGSLRARLHRLRLSRSWTGGAQRKFRVDSVISRYREH